MRTFNSFGSLRFDSDLNIVIRVIAITTIVHDIKNNTFFTLNMMSGFISTTYIYNIYNLFQFKFVKDDKFGIIVFFVSLCLLMLFLHIMEPHIGHLTNGFLLISIVFSLSVSILKQYTISTYNVYEFVPFLICFSCLFPSGNNK